MKPQAAGEPMPMLILTVCIQHKI